MDADTGGVLQPNMGAVNFSNQPERVLTDAQWRTMKANHSNNPPMAAASQSTAT